MLPCGGRGWRVGHQPGGGGAGPGGECPVHTSMYSPHPPHRPRMGPPPPTPPPPAVYATACNNDKCGLLSQFTATLKAGVGYAIVVDGAGGESGPYNLTLTAASGAVVAGKQPPASLLKATFSVAGTALSGSANGTASVATSSSSGGGGGSSSSSSSNDSASAAGGSRSLPALPWFCLWGSSCEGGAGRGGLSANVACCLAWPIPQPPLPDPPPPFPMPGASPPLQAPPTSTALSLRAPLSWRCREPTSPGRWAPGGLA